MQSEIVTPAEFADRLDELADEGQEAIDRMLEQEEVAE